MCDFVKNVIAKSNTQSGAIQVLDDDERRVESKLLQAAARMSMNMWAWSTSQGLRLVSPEMGEKEVFNGERASQPEVAAPQVLLQKLSEWKAGPSMVVVKDFNSLLNRVNNAPILARLMKDLNTSMLNAVDANFVQVVVLDSEEAQFNCGYQKVDLPLPDRKEMSQILDEILPALDDKMRAAAEADKDKILNAVAGLPANQASNALAESISRKGSLDPRAISDYKKQLVSSKGLEIIDPDPRGLDAIGGMEPVKEFARECEFNADFLAEYDLSAPKGGIWAGYPGTGKSALAKALASHWGFVLLRADLGSARGMYQGQSEEGIDNILKTAEAVAPCVLWIDEVEKALSGAGGGGQTDGGTGDRMFAKLLTFMQETTKPVFFFLTANRPDQLPSEFTRAGRLDKQYWLGLPSRSARKSILNVFAAKYSKASQIDVDALVDASEGYTGAEIEVAVKGALRTAMSQRAPEATTEMVLAKLKSVTKVADTFQMTEAMQKWADAADKADAPESESPTNTSGSGGRRIRNAG